MNWNTVIAGHFEKLSVRKIGPQKWGTEECSPIMPPVWSYFIGCPEKQQRPLKQRGKSLLANETENGNTWKNANDTVTFGFSPAFHWVTGRRQFSRQSQSEIMQNQSNLRLFWMPGYKFSWYFPVIQIVFHSAFVTKPCSTFPKPLFQNEGKSWRLFQPQWCQLFLLGRKNV